MQGPSIRLSTARAECAVSVYFLPLNILASSSLSRSFLQPRASNHAAQRSKRPVDLFPGVVVGCAFRTGFFVIAFRCPARKAPGE